MSSFKLDKGQSNKKQFMSGGVLLMLLGLVVGPLFDYRAGGVFFLIGLVLAVGSAFSTE